jgi:hypothetical protein
MSETYQIKADETNRIRDTNGKIRNAGYATLQSESIKGRDNTGDLGVYGTIILRWILRKFM